MTYLVSIKTAFLLYPFISILITIPFILIEYHKYGSINKIRTLIIYSFILYLMTLYFLVILPLPSIEKVQHMIRVKPILIPFSFIRNIIRETSFVWNNPSTYLKALIDPCIYTVIFNIIMTIPFGMYLRYYFKCDLKKTIKYSFLLSLFFELTQLTGLYYIYPKPYRVFDVDDLMMNALGGYLGYLLMGKFTKLLPTRDIIDEDTYKNSKIVSGLRRITLFCIDITIYFTIEIFINIFIFHNRLTKYMIFIIYFVIVPYFWKGKTIGSNFVKVRFSTNNKKMLRLLIKAISQFVYYIFLPLGIIFCTAFITTNYNFTVEAKILTILSVFIIIFIYYLINIIFLIKNKRMFYDKFSKIEFTSIIDNYRKN